MEVSNQLHAPPGLLLGKNSRYPLGGLQSRSWSGGEEDIPAPAGNRTPVVQPIA